MPLHVSWTVRLRALAGLCALIVVLGVGAAAIVVALALGAAQALGAV